MIVNPSRSMKIVRKIVPRDRGAAGVVEAEEVVGTAEGQQSSSILQAKT